ncbi:hypothetical protein ACFSCZ_12230 [Siminovitchia sediminis]|uniref:Uncharacterized protein n=1 Tax=Siminovitchia sediminis TaxID=1274353 RepID=A0ABW4KH69_9BACI
MERESMIEKNMKSSDEFVRKLFTDLQGRIQDYEREESNVKKMTKLDALPELVIVAAFTVFLLTVIL